MFIFREWMIPFLLDFNKISIFVGNMFELVIKSILYMFTISCFPSDEYSLDVNIVLWSQKDMHY